MKDKLINVLLTITSLFGYLEWGGDNKMFLYQAIADIFNKIFTAPASVLHPFIVLPLTGIFILICTLFQKMPGRILTFFGIGCIGLLLAFMCVIGVISLNYKIMLSTVPFLAMATYTIFRYKNKMVSQ